MSIWGHMRSAGWGLVLVWLLLAGPAESRVPGVRATARPIRIDGILEEWGPPERIPIVPGVENVGLRGSFEGLEDHEVDLYLMWDARFLYAAVVVEDNILDAARVGPKEYVWKGPGGQRKDKMFYYDHLKVFVRGPEAPLGYNMWISPAHGEEGPYIWGAQQRGISSEDLPVQVGSAQVPGIYTYELAIPWEWLRVLPQPDMQLDAMFLLPDADLPGVAINKKIGQRDKWIWWKGKIQLQGRPPGLPPPPVASDTGFVPITVSKHRPEEAGQKTGTTPDRPPETGLGIREDEKATGDESPVQVAVEEVAATAPSPAPVAGLMRQLLQKKQPKAPPAWLSELGDGNMSQAQLEILFRRLIHHVLRLNDERVDSRTDAVIFDMAESGEVWRSQARGFMERLLGRVQEEVRRQEGGMRNRVGQAAQEMGIAEEQAVVLVEELCVRARKLYAKNKVISTSELVDQATRKADLSAAQVRELALLLLEEWAE